MKRTRGLTLLEVMIAICLIAIIASLAAPSFGGSAERARLKSAAETLAADFSEARHEAASRGGALHVEPVAGPDWCWSVATTATCGCGANACSLKAEHAQQHPGIALVEGSAARFGADGMAEGGHALFRSSRGETLRVDVTALGRARVCSPGASVPGVTPCP